MPSAMNRLRDVALLTGDADALRDALRKDDGGLGAALGVSVDQLRELSSRRDVSDRLRDLVLRARHREAALRDDGRRERALVAAERLVAGVRWLDAGVELEPRVLLGDLLADTAKPWLSLVVDGSDVVVSRARLRRAALALRPFGDTRALVDSQALRLRWRGGLGGLNFNSQVQHVRDDSLVLRVVLSRPAAQPAKCARPRRADRRGWLTDVLTEVVG